LPFEADPNWPTKHTHERVFPLAESWWRLKQFESGTERDGRASIKYGDEGVEREGKIPIEVFDSWQREEAGEQTLYAVLACSG
jgi:hypothetical protein